LIQDISAEPAAAKNKMGWLISLSRAHLSPAVAKYCKVTEKNMGPRKFLSVIIAAQA
jgi:hypothetical protein